MHDDNNTQHIGNKSVSDEVCVEHPVLILLTANSRVDGDVITVPCDVWLGKAFSGLTRCNLSK